MERIAYKDIKVLREGHSYNMVSIMFCWRKLAIGNQLPNISKWKYIQEWNPILRVKLYFIFTCNHREIKDRESITSFPPCTAMSQKIDKEIRISLSMSSVFYPQSHLIYLSIIITYPLFIIYYPQSHLIYYENDLCL